MGVGVGVGEHPITGVEDGFPPDCGKRGLFQRGLREGEFSSGNGRRQGREKRGVFILVVGGKLHPNRGEGVGMYPIRRDGGLFSPGKGWKKAEFQRKSRGVSHQIGREDDQGRRGVLIRGWEKGNIQGWRGGRQEGSIQKWEERREFKKKIFMYFIQHCFVCRSSDFAASEDAGIESNPGLLRDLCIGSQML